MDPELDLYWVFLREDVSKHDETAQQRCITVQGDAPEGEAAQFASFSLTGTNYHNSIPAPMAEVEGVPPVAAEGQKRPAKRKSAGGDGTGCGRAAKKPNSEARQNIEKRRKRATALLGMIRALRAALPSNDALAAPLLTVLANQAEELGTARASAAEAIDAWERGNRTEEELAAASENFQSTIKEAENFVAQGKLRAKQLNILLAE